MSKVWASGRNTGKEIKVSVGRDYRIELGKDNWPVVKPFKIGQVVLDDLTGEITNVVNIVPISDMVDESGNIVVYNGWKGNWIQVKSRCKPNWDGSVWDEGWRYEWEVNHVEKISAHGK